MKLSHAVALTAGAVLAVALRAEHQHKKRQEQADKHHAETAELSREHHQQQLRLGVAGLHQQLLADISADPAHQEIWAKDGRSPEEMARFARVNRQVSLTQVTYELGLIDLDELHVRARALMEREEVRNFWAATRDFRFQESQDAESREFVEALDYAHIVVSVEGSTKS